MHGNWLAAPSRSEFSLKTYKVWYFTRWVWLRNDKVIMKRFRKIIIIKKIILFSNFPKLRKFQCTKTLKFLHFLSLFKSVCLIIPLNFTIEISNFISKCLKIVRLLREWRKIRPRTWDLKKHNLHDLDDRKKYYFE